MAVLLHEAAHLLVEQRNAKPRRALIVHVIGSVPYAACSGRGPADFWANVAGPAASLVLSVLTFWAALNAGPFSRPVEALMGTWQL